MMVSWIFMSSARGRRGKVSKRNELMKIVVFGVGSIGRRHVGNLIGLGFTSVSVIAGGYVISSRIKSPWNR